MPVFNLLVSSYFLLLVPIVTFYFNSWIRYPWVYDRSFLSRRD